MLCLFITQNIYLFSSTVMIIREILLNKICCLCHDLNLRPPLQEKSLLDPFMLLTDSPSTILPYKRSSFSDAQNIYIFSGFIWHIEAMLRKASFIFHIFVSSCKEWHFDWIDDFFNLLIWHVLLLSARYIFIIK